MATHRRYFFPDVPQDIREHIKAVLALFGQDRMEDCSVAATFPDGALEVFEIRQPQGWIQYARTDVYGAAGKSRPGPEQALQAPDGRWWMRSVKPNARPVWMDV